MGDTSLEPYIGSFKINDFYSLLQFTTVTQLVSIIIAPISKIITALLSMQSFSVNLLVDFQLKLGC